MTRRDAATERQVQAARPDRSTWLAANAGSGKTRVLTDRVARLLLNGVDPQRILCLTYTKAAASEMQNRLFKRLGGWAMLDDDHLRQALETLGAGQVAQDRLSDARTLFARAIETPGGLKIQTIHSFCATLLRRFPLEAGVSPQFTEMEDRAATRLRAEIVEEMAAGSQSHLIDGIATYLSDEGLDDLIAEITRNREAFFPAKTDADLSSSLGLETDTGEDVLLDTVFQSDTVALIKHVAPILATGGKTDASAAAKLALVTAPSMDALRILETVLLTGGSAKSPYSAKIGSFPTKALRSGPMDGLMPEIDDLMTRVEDARRTRCALDAARKSQALHAFAQAFLPEYAARKQARGWLDFDDLILLARRLLNDSAVAAWVLYRLDGGIDHILVDEAQDTSPGQWDVIEKLAQEFTSGQTARSDAERTIFVVGDKKQSIYSFQGADPDAFDRMQAEFGNRLRRTQTGLQDLTLDHSFRSSAAILTLVDQVFRGRDSAGFPQSGQHIAFKSELPGRVDLWPVIEPRDSAEDPPWYEPVDRPSTRHETVELATAIAAQIKEMIDIGATLPDDAAGRGSHGRRPVEPGDFLILVRRRSDLFAEIIRACKAAELPIAGADRLKVGAELAVKDLGALLSFLATPEDDLSLASALKSPLFGLGERALFGLAHGRGNRFLWVALREQRDAFPLVLEMLDDLLGQTDFLRPYDLIERILTRHGGRRALLARLGPEAEDGINALLSQALAYERTEVPSLTGFLQWMETDDLEIKRQVGTANGQIRVMTVHGSKGLESPIVILPDTGPWRSRAGSGVLVAGGTPLWRMRSDDMPDVMRTAAVAEIEKQENERLRLLYVALTRAEKWLIVAAAGKIGKSGETWYDLILDAMTEVGATEHAFPTGDGLRLAFGDWDSGSITGSRQLEPAEVQFPELFRTHATAPADRPAILRPSDLGGAKALPGDMGLDEDLAKQRGTDLHLLLEHLPGTAEAGWLAKTDTLLADRDPLWREALLTEAIGVLTRPGLAFIFDRAALVEVEITATLGHQRLHGKIDRLIVAPDRVLAIDFKSNATVPARPSDTPEGLLRQMGAYRAALTQVYPDVTVETGILWTRTATFHALPHDLVTEALRRAACLDDA
ncbi:MAG: double-strand break repair helicase AddA [Pseudomonadota bacterium]